MPKPNALSAMLESVRYGDQDVYYPQLGSDLHSSAYIGRDYDKFPYGQLTDLGVHQMMSVGHQLRNRYLNNLRLEELNDDFSRSIICRSTNICRTMQSISALLYGLLDIENLGRKENKLHLPKLQFRPRNEETMYSLAGGPCPAMEKREKEILLEQILIREVDGYLKFEEKMKNLLGCDKVDWFNVKEVLASHEVHNITMCENMDEIELKVVTHITDVIEETLCKVR